jgi:hypothetical protein
MITIHWLRVLVGVCSGDRKFATQFEKRRREAGDELFCAVPDGFGHGADKQHYGAGAESVAQMTAGGSAPAVVPEIDHRIGERLNA